LLTIFLSLGFACNQTKESAFKATFCDVEVLNEHRKMVSNKNSEHVFAGELYRTDSMAHSGSYSLYANEETTSVFNFEIQNPKVGQWFKVSVWKFDPENTGELLVYSESNPEIRFAGGNVLSREPSGWTQIVLFVQAPEGTENLFFSCRNQAKKTIFFDDFEVTVMANGSVPSVLADALKIHIDTAAINEFEQKVDEAIKNGVEVSDEYQYLPAIMFYGGNQMQADIKLKSINTNYIEDEYKPYRINLKKRARWNTMQRFSLAHPGQGAYLATWFAHELFASEGLIAGKYGFVPLILNGENKGIYAYEEHFDNEMLERFSRNENMMLRFDNSAAKWLYNFNLNKKKAVVLPVYEAAKIIPYKENSVLTDPKQLKRFNSAANLLNGFKAGDLPANEVFDLPKIAKFVALAEVLGAYNALEWNNLRFYYNPIIHKLEFILNDAYADNLQLMTETDDLLINKYRNASISSDNPLYFLYNLFADPEFITLYIQALGEYSNPERIKNELIANKANLEERVNLLKQSFPSYKFKSEEYIQRAERINFLLKNALVKRKKRQKEPLIAYSDTLISEIGANLMNAYTQFSSEKEKRILINNFNSKPIYIKEFTNSTDVTLKEKAVQTLVPAFMNGTPGSSELVVPNWVTGFNTTESKFDTVKIAAWSYSEHYLTDQRVIANFIENRSVFTHSGRYIIISKGKHVLNRAYVIPKGFILKIEPGAQLIFENNGFILSQAPVLAKGTARNPIIFSCKTENGQGLAILNTDELSEFEHVEFVGLNSFKMGSLFYESAITCYNAVCRFSNLKFSNIKATEALGIYNSKVELDSIHWNNLSGSALVAGFSEILIRNSSISKATLSGIIANNSHVQIENCTFSEIKQHAIEANTNCSVTVQSCKISNSNIALISNKNAQIFAQNISLRNCAYNFIAYGSRAYTPLSTVSVQRFESVAESNMSVIEQGSLLILNTDTTKGTIKNYLKYYTDLNK